MVAITGALVLGSGYWWLGPEEHSAQAGVDTPAALYTARRADLPITVVENGYLKAKNNTEIKPRFHRSSTITWLDGLT